MLGNGIPQYDKNPQLYKLNFSKWVCSHVHKLPIMLLITQPVLTSSTLQSTRSKINYSHATCTFGLTPWMTLPSHEDGA